MVRSVKERFFNLIAKQQIVGVALVIMLFFVLIFGLNYYTPLYGDDYLYAHSFLTGERLTALEQVIPSQISHYQVMNGRMITHILAQAFQLLGDGAFNVVNTVFFIVLLFVIYYHGYGTLKNFSVKRFAGIFLMLFLSCPAFGQSFLWMTGAANYLYGLLIVLLFLIPYRHQINNDFVHYSFIKAILLAVLAFAFGIVAGWTNENTVAALLVMCTAYCVMSYLKNKRLHAWSVTGLIGAVIGFVLMLTAPGTLNRMGKFGGSGGIIAWLKRAILYTCDMLVNMPLLIILFAVIVCVYFAQKKALLVWKKPKKLFLNLRETYVAALYLLGFIASVYAMVVAPLFPERAWTCCVVLLLISTCNMEKLLDRSVIAVKTGGKIAFVLALIICIGSYVNAFFELKNVTVAYNNRMALISQAQERNEDVVELPAINGETGYCTYGANGDLSDDSSSFPNYAIAYYFGFDEVKGK